MKVILKKVLAVLLGDYEIYWVYRKDIPSSVVDTKLSAGVSFKTLSEDDLLNKSGLFEQQKNYLGEQAIGYGLYADGQLVSACFYWFAERYKQRGFICLPNNAAKLVQIVTAPQQQGKGYAAMLLSQSAVAMQRQGFKQLYARVWHNNHASNAIFKKNQWQRLYLRIRVFPLGRSLTFSLPI